MTVIALLLAGRSAAAQGADDLDLGGLASPKEPYLTLEGGFISSSPRGEFPSVIMENSIAGTGSIPAELGETGSGYLIALDFGIPFSTHFLLNLHAGTRAWSVGYAPDSLRFSTTFTVQTFYFGLGPQVNIWVDESSFASGDPGLRAAFVGVRLGFDPSILGNRLESSATTDSTLAQWRPATGHFQGSEPFRVGVDLSVNAGFRFGFDADFEVVPALTYSHRLNPVFSSRAITDSDFTVDLLAVTLGLSFRI